MKRGKARDVEHESRTSIIKGVVSSMRSANSKRYNLRNSDLMNWDRKSDNFGRGNTIGTIGRGIHLRQKMMKL